MEDLAMTTTVTVWRSKGIFETKLI